VFYSEVKHFFRFAIEAMALLDDVFVPSEGSAAAGARTSRGDAPTMDSAPLVCDCSFSLTQ
jgi:hypothetical protein